MIKMMMRMVCDGSLQDVVLPWSTLSELAEQHPIGNYRQVESLHC